MSPAVGSFAANCSSYYTVVLVNILIVKIAAIGDVVMALPLLTYIRNQHPHAHITWVCGSQVKSLVEATNLVDHILVIDESKLYRGNIAQKLGVLSKVWKQLVGVSFDLCLTLHPDPRYRWISWPIRCKDRRYWTRQEERMNPVPGRYHTEEVIRLFTGSEEPTEISIQFPVLHIPHKESLRVRMTALGPQPIVALAPGGARNALADDALRRWPIDSYRALMKQLSSYPVQLVVTGGQSDLWVVDHLKEIPHVNLIGALDLLDLIVTLQQCKLLITHDSGPLHSCKN